MSKYLKLLGLAVLILTFVTACDKSKSGKMKLAFVTNNSSDFWTIARAGCEKAEAELGDVELLFRMPSDSQVSVQRQLVEDLLVLDTKGIAISPIDASNQTPMIDDWASKTLVVCQDSDAANSKRAAYVGTDNVAAGRQAGELIKKALPNGGKVMAFVGNMDAQNAQERFKGIKDVLAGSNITIVDVRTDGTERARAKQNVADTIVASPDITCMVGLYSYNGPAILNAVKESNKSGTIKIVCFDEEDETLAGVKDGAIFGTVVQQPYEFGYQAVKLMHAYLKGDKSVIPDNKLKVVPTRIIDKANVEEFTAELKKLRGK